MSQIIYLVLKIKQKTYQPDNLNNNVDSTSYIYSSSYKNTNDGLLQNQLSYSHYVSQKTNKELTISNKADTDTTSYIYTKALKKAEFLEHEISARDYIQEIPVENNRVEVNENTNLSYFLLGTFLLGIIILIFSKSLYKNHIKTILLSVISYRSSNNYFREHSKNPKKINIFLSLNYYISSSIFIIASLMIYKILPISSILPTTAVILFILLILNNLQLFLNKILGIIFLKIQLSKEYNFNLKLFNQAIGIAFIPILLLIAYSDFPKIAIIIGLISASLTLIIRTLRLAKINMQHNINILYLFLYFCTLEIIPVLLLLNSIDLLISRTL